MALKPGPLDSVIGDKPRSAAEIRDAIAKSKQFAEIVEKAVKVAKPLPPGEKGAPYSQQIREAIINQLRGEAPDALPE